MKWLPPVTGIRRIRSWFDKSKGKLVRVEIENEPETLDTLLTWVEERKAMGYETEIYRCYLRDAEMHGYAVKLSPDHPFRNDYVRNHATLRIALRYVLTYAGYSLKYHRTKIDAHKAARTVQVTLTEKLSEAKV